MIPLLLIPFACQNPTENHPDFSTVLDSEDTDTGSEDTSTDTGDTGEDTGEVVDDNRVSFFSSFDVDCSRLEMHTLTLTRLIPGELNPNPTHDPKFDLTASFWKKKHDFS